ncbi:MAG: TonB-dependent hemoglobin/transferrin/lactoferrin family receptor [Alysiella sp.]|uniref:TonB-dependent hemoglobin/transferrin/lactoferrin family receptor n=1 Tax=Alysiella sp. TaxID=1872483 RepID=UPI0026DC0765|nr:TonB-dependent hemoglobin/transferrin/lactoferrin family receptor [Alysiella sp.]MDO4433007.1 TonB-dependent hemoglobin/transferrin/lactoferrin family receptor [Alysiella sp.]
MQTHIKKPFRLSTIAFSIMLTLSAGGGNAHAADAVEANGEPQTAVQELKTINVKGNRNRTSPTVERKNREAINREMIRDTRDLVRYSADVGVAENGRRMKGFAMRGVEDNRVGISIDGVSLPTSEENSLFARYGNFNNSRLSIDTELVKSIEITKGSDSFNSGSGALGGNVNYRTLDANDILLPDRNLGGMIKSGYATKNREWVNTFGVGFQNDTFDAALLYSYRHGHEMKSRGGDITPYWGNRYDTQAQRNANALLSKRRIYPDPMDTKSKSYLAKLGWNITPEHRVSLNVNGQAGSNYVYEYSYASPRTEGKYWREGNDKQNRVNTNLAYEFMPENGFLNKVKVEFDHQKTKNTALTYSGEWEYDSTISAYVLGKKSTSRYATITFYDRLNINTLKKWSIGVESNPFSFLGGEHSTSLKVYTSKNLFENKNKDSILNLDGTLSRWIGAGQPNPDIYTIQYPMQTKTYGINFLNKTTWNDTFSSVFGLGYDLTKVQALETDMKCGAWSSLGKLCLGKPEGTTFKNWNGILGLNAKLNDTWKLGSYVSSGYRVPNASELYFSFDSGFGAWNANPNLKSERSINYGFNLQGKGQLGDLDLNLYHTRYRNFLHEQESHNIFHHEYCLRDPAYCDLHHISAKDWRPAQQMINSDKAKVWGLEFASRLNLSALHQKLDGWKLSFNMGYSKGTIQGKDAPKLSMLSIQPLKAVFGLDYEAPNGTWGIFNRISFMAAKKAKDAQYAGGTKDKPNGKCLVEGWTSTPHPIYWWVSTYTKGCNLKEQEAVAKDYPYLNKKSWVYDVFGYYRPNKNLTLRAGIYNVFNVKYHTWDTLRGINTVASTTNMVDNQLQGLERYYAPPRNYALSLEWKF